MSTKETNIFPDFPSVIRYLLDSNELSQADFSKKSGFDRGQVSKWVSGTNVPFRKTQLKIGKILGADISQQEDGNWLVTHHDKQTSDLIAEADDLLNQYREQTDRLKAAGPGKESDRALLLFLKSVLDEHLKDSDS